MAIAEELGEKVSAALYEGNIGLNYYYIVKFNLKFSATALVSNNKRDNLFKSIDFLQRGIRGCRDAHYQRGIDAFTPVLESATALNKTLSGK